MKLKKKAVLESLDSAAALYGREMEASAALLALGNVLEVNRAAAEIKKELAEAAKNKETWKKETERILAEETEIAIIPVEAAKMGCRLKPSEAHKIIFMFG